MGLGLKYVQLQNKLKGLEDMLWLQKTCMEQMDAELELKKNEIIDLKEDLEKLKNSLKSENISENKEEPILYLG